MMIHDTLRPGTFVSFQVCLSSDRLPLDNHAGLLRCMDGATCPAMTDDIVQIIADLRCVDMNGEIVHVTALTVAAGVWYGALSRRG